MLTNIKTFSGFYESIWLNSESESNEIDWIIEKRDSKGLKDEIDFYEYEFNYDEYKNDIGKQYADIWASDLSDFITSCKFVGFDSPRYYNFTTDKLEVEVELNEEKILSFIDQNFEAFEEYIKNHHSSYDGFISFYSNSGKDWMLSDDLLTDYVKIASALDFILSQINDDYKYYDGILYDAIGPYLTCINAQELIERPDETPEDVSNSEEEFFFPYWNSLKLEFDQMLNPSQYELFMK